MNNLRIVKRYICDTCGAKLPVDHFNQTSVLKDHNKDYKEKHNSFSEEIEILPPITVEKSIKMIDNRILVV